MPVIAPLEVALSRDEVLERLQLSSPAFSARSAPAAVTDILETIEEDHLLIPQASYAFHAIGRTDRQRMEFSDGTVLSFEEPSTDHDAADSMLSAAWTLGPRVSTAVSDAFAKKRYLDGFLLHEIASLFLFKLGENLFEQLSEETAARGKNIGRAICPGDEELDISVQETVSALAQAGRIGIELGSAGALAPTMSATAVAFVGNQIQAPQHRWSCDTCRARKNCRLRHRQKAGAGLGTSSDHNQ